MDTLPITLIVKAPNQQIEDQTIKCERSWTITKLKQHLSEVYPSKPPQHEQKLIYSGQLLADQLVLKDVLRQYDEDHVHTVHLVCTSATSSYHPKVEQTTSRPSQELDQQQALWQQQQQIMQLAWMQQQWYMHYVLQQRLQSENNNQHEEEQQQEPVHQPQQQIVEENEHNNEPQRDWLDMFFIASRLFILVSIVYFYSSPLRFAVVVLLGFTIYLYQIGFFRNTNNTNSDEDETNQQQHTPTRFTMAWSFVTGFFTSLIPDIPNPI